MAIVLGAPLFAGLVTYLILRSLFLVPADKSKTDLISVEVGPGMSFGDIATTLKEKGVVRRAWTLRIMSRLRKADTKISSGEYSLSPSMTQKEILSKLVSGDVIKRTILIKEGLNIWEAAKVIGESGLLTEEEFKKALVDPELLRKWGVPGRSFEGYLFPNTYYFSRPITAEEVIGTFIKEGEKNWDDSFTQKADELRMTRHDILTLASIIEKESGNKDEQPLISSVFHNRLKEGMKLQSDPTVIYGIPNFNGNLTRVDLETPTAYNTYTNFGLPPGPIANPGLTAIKAALNPAYSNFLFFVADGRGGHKFSTTLRDHNTAVAQFLSIRKADEKDSLGASILGTTPAVPPPSPPTTIPSNSQMMQNQLPPIGR